MKNIKSIRDFDLKDHHVLIRVDFNTPLTSHTGIADDSRLRAVLPTIRHAAINGAKVILISHLGRPPGRVQPELTLRPIARRLGELLGKNVGFVPDCVGRMAESATEKMAPGDIILLENLRFHTGETGRDTTFARRLAKLADIYINDAFAKLHRAHASTTVLPNQFEQKGIGLLIEKELRTLDKVMKKETPPLLMIVGGNKLSTKVDILRHMIGKVDQLMLGGAMVNTFFAAKDMEVGRSVMEPDYVEIARDILAEAGVLGCRILLPQDLMVISPETAISEAHSCASNSLNMNEMALDIGPKTTEIWSRVIQNAGTILWVGPLGSFEIAPFHEGTFNIAKAVTKSKAFSLIAGKEMLHALRECNLLKDVNEVSTASGAFVDLLHGRILPGLRALEEKQLTIAA